MLAIALAKDVIDCGRANVNVLSASAHASPAHYATRLGSIELLQALTAQKADLSLQDAEGRTVLHVAVRMACAGRDAALPVMKLLVNSEFGGGPVQRGCWEPCAIPAGHRIGSGLEPERLTGQGESFIALLTDRPPPCCPRCCVCVQVAPPLTYRTRAA